MRETLERGSTKGCIRVEDPKSPKHAKHPLKTLIGTTILGSLAGINDFGTIAGFVDNHLENLKKCFYFPCGVPSFDTYQRLWDTIHPERLYTAFLDFVDTILHLKGITGQTVRNNHYLTLFDVISVGCESDQLALTQQKGSEYGYDAKDILKTLFYLSLGDRVVTVDTVGAERDICEQIIEQKGDYLISLKSHQEDLFEDVKLYFQSDEALEKCLFSKAYLRKRGGVEERSAWATDDVKG